VKYGRMLVANLLIPWSAVAAGAATSCACLGGAGYGQACAHWDAADEAPWCRVARPESCGADDTFESDGHSWSHKPCGGEGRAYDGKRAARRAAGPLNAAGDSLKRCKPGQFLRRGPVSVGVEATDYAMMGNGRGTLYGPGGPWDPPGAMWGPQPSTTSPYVIAPLRMLLCAAAKVGSETWRQFVQRADPRPNSRKYAGYNRLHLRELPPANARALLQDNSWLKAAFVREPAERLLSAYLNKVRNQQDGKVSLMLYAQNLGLGEEGSAKLGDLSFGAFVGLVARQAPDAMNIHWNLQSLNCNLGKWRAAYSFVGCFERVSQDSKCLLQSVGYAKDASLGNDGRSCRNCNQTGGWSAWSMVGMHGWGAQQGGRLFPERPKAVLGGHATSAKTKMDKYYTPELLRKVRRIYAEDYRQFGAHCDWDWDGSGEP